MEAIVLNTSFENVGVIDDFESFIWTDRYSEAGDFEISTYPGSEIIEIAQKNYYLYFKESDHVMIIESLNLTTDVDNGTRLIISGRSLESILDRRIVWGMMEVSGNVNACIKSLISRNIMSPSIQERTISNFLYTDTTDSYILGTTMSSQYTGDNLYDVIKSICDELDIGFKIRLTAANNFRFSLYNGKDRSYNQSTLPYVVFSPAYENIINSNYLDSDTDWRNVALVAGEDRSTSRKTAVVGTKSGLKRRELYVDARDIQSENEQGQAYTDAEYTNLLKKRGKEYLAEHTKLQAFEGDVETKNSFVYGTDYFLGDIVQVQNEYGYGAAMRVSEVVFSQDESGINILPTFRTLIGEE